MSFIIIFHYHLFHYFPSFSILFHPFPKSKGPFGAVVVHHFQVLWPVPASLERLRRPTVWLAVTSKPVRDIAIARWFFFQPLGERSDAGNHGPVKSGEIFVILRSLLIFWCKNLVIGQGSTWFFGIFWVGSPHQVMEGTEIAVFLPNLGKPAIQSPVRVDSDYNPW